MSRVAFGRFQVLSFNPAHATRDLEMIGSFLGTAFEKKRDAVVVCCISRVTEVHLSTKTETD